MLDGGYSARLPSRLERGDAVATSVGTSYDAFTRGDSLFIFSGIPNEARNIDLPQLEEAIWKEIDELKQNRWLDKNSRSVEAAFVIFNSAKQMFCLVAVQFLHLETGKIENKCKFEVGAMCMIKGGNNTGRVGVITTREKHPGSSPCSAS